MTSKNLNELLCKVPNSITYDNIYGAFNQSPQVLSFSPASSSFLEVGETCIDVRFGVFGFCMLPALHFRCGANECLHTHLALQTKPTSLLDDQKQDFQSKYFRD